MRQKLPNEREAREQQAHPDSRAEIERHPGHLALPAHRVMGDDPSRADVVEAGEQPEELASVRELGLPAEKIHRHVDGAHERHVAGDADGRRGERPLHDAAVSVHEIEQGDRDEQEGRRPERVFQHVAQIVRCDDRVPGASLRSHDQRNDGPGDISRRFRSGRFGKHAQNDRPLHGETDFRDGGDGSADEDTGEPGIEQANPLNVGAGQHGAEGAAKNIRGAQQQQRLRGDCGGAPGRARPAEIRKKEKQ